MKIYLASSWRNPKQPAVLAALRAAGHEVYDFRNPVPGNKGFSWRQLEQGDPKEWSPETYRDTVRAHPVARRGFKYDMDALRSADVTVLLLPCGRSAHLELGYAVAARQSTVVLLDEKIDEPELMYLMCSAVCLNVQEVIDWLGRHPATDPVERERRAILDIVDDVRNRRGEETTPAKYPLNEVTRLIRDRR